jgi:hypothetical protein
MARKAKSPDTPKSVVVPTQQQDSDPKGTGLDLDKTVSLLNKWVGESQSHFNGKDYNLDKATKENEKYYLGNQAGDLSEDSDATLDNRIFSSIRTVVPYTTTRVTQPEVYPSSNAVEASKFAQDFEKALHVKATQEQIKDKLKPALEDAIIRRRGYLKLRYDGVAKNFCKVEYIPAESIIVDHKARPFEEPRYFRHVLDTTIEDMLTMFPDNRDKVLAAFEVTEEELKADDNLAYKEVSVNEDWMFKRSGSEQDLFVVWHYNDTPIAAIQDPNWRYGDNNFIPHHMMPLVPVNVLNDGRSWIDRTSFVEQAKYSQSVVDKRSKQISKSAGLGSTGMPVVDNEALPEEEAHNLTYDEETVIGLDVPEGKTIRDVFDKWQANPLPGFVFDDKVDARTAVDNAFGTSALTRGEGSDSATLGQDILIRDQGQGRQQEIIDAIDKAMFRLYQLMAQFMLVYGTEEEMFQYVGENAEFDVIIMNSDDLDTKALINVKAGTSMPIDKAQRRATADKAAQMNMIDPFTYWKIMDEPNAQENARRIAEWTADPAGFMSDVNKEVFNREAYSDIQKLKRGEQPEYRETLEPEYFAYLADWIKRGNLNSPLINPIIKEVIRRFVEEQLVRGGLLTQLAETQLPTPQEVNDHNASVDEANAAAPPPEASPGAISSKPDPNKQDTAPGESPTSTPPMPGK